MILYASDSQWSWEEDAYLLGGKPYLGKPVRARLLNSVLDRLLARQAPRRNRGGAIRPRPEVEAGAGPGPDPDAARWRLLRNYSSILSQSERRIDAREFLLSLRKIIGVNRAAIFLREPPGGVAGDSLQPVGARRLHSACAIGLAPGLLEHLELSLESGIGGHLFRSRADAAPGQRGGGARPADAQGI